MLDSNKLIPALTISITAMTLGACLSDEPVDTSLAQSSDTTQNSAPVIAGSPGDAIRMGDTYVFTPSASDADGDNLIFSVDGLPGWADFDAATGEISGQPLLGDQGLYSQIVISVSDGDTTSALPPFSITVTEVALGSMTLSWTAPTTNTDGTALTDLSGFRLYYGRTEGTYPFKVTVDNVGLASYVVDNLLPSTYYVVATSVNAAGIESSYSNVAVRVVEGG